MMKKSELRFPERLVDFFFFLKCHRKSFKIIPISGKIDRRSRNEIKYSDEATSEKGVKVTQDIQKLFNFCSIMEKGKENKKKR